MGERLMNPATGFGFSGVFYVHHCHAGLDPASRKITVLQAFWIPAFAGMTV
jgi:hypothetical protein